MGYFINQMSQKHVAPFLQSDVLSVVCQQCQSTEGKYYIEIGGEIL